MVNPSIFVVLVRTGIYSDKHAEVVRAFDNKRDADNFARELEIKNSVTNGLIQAHDRIMDDWKKRNPAPVEDPHAETNYYSTEEYKAWDKAFYAEAERVRVVLGIENTHAEDYFSAQVKEVPLGNPCRECEYHPDHCNASNKETH